MVEKTLSSEILKIVGAESNNNPAPQLATVKRVIDNKHCHVTIDNDHLINIEYIGKLKEGTKCLIEYIDGSLRKPVAIGVQGTGGGGGSLVGTFYIDDNGYLHARLPKGSSNPYYIDSDGYLHYTTCESE